MNTKDQMMSNEYLSSLVKLTSKCDRTIEALTALAKQNIVHASIIVDTIAKHINNDEVDSEFKMSILYLIDSIIRNVGGIYKGLFMGSILKMFCGVLANGNEQVRQEMLVLRNSWTKTVFPDRILLMLDVKANAIDESWPIVIPSTDTSISPKHTKTKVHANTPRKRLLDEEDLPPGLTSPLKATKIECEDKGVKRKDEMKKNIIAEKWKHAGNEQYKAQDYRLALRFYSDAISICPDTPTYYCNRAACHMMLANYKAAHKDSRRAVQIDNTFEKGYLRLAKCCIALGKVESAEQAIKRIFELNAKSTIADAEIQSCSQLRIHQDTARSSYQTQDYRTAINHADSAVKIAPAGLKFKLLKAECLALLGLNNEANELALFCMKMDFTNAEAVYVYGLCLYFSGDLKNSINQFNRSSKLDPDNVNPNVQGMRFMAIGLKEKKDEGKKLYEAGNFRAAFTVLTKALAIDPRNNVINSNLYYNRALVNIKIGNTSDAIKDSSRALEANVNYLKPLLLRADCHIDLQNFEEAIKDYETALKIENSNEIQNKLKEAKLALDRFKRNFYNILGIYNTATDQDIKNAYYKLALQHHPDKHSNASVVERRKQEEYFKKVLEAYTTLSDPTQRRRYDTEQYNA